jgi:hypothetical protein
MAITQQLINKLISNNKLTIISNIYLLDKFKIIINTNNNVLKFSKLRRRKVIKLVFISRPGR